MPIVQTPKELGLAIRARRKELGWDQATLAAQVGVTRQWVIEMEKGKPRVELDLALRALRALGLFLSTETKRRTGDSRMHAGDGPGTPDLDIDGIVESNRGVRSGGTPGAIAESWNGFEPARRRDALQTPSGLPKTAADYLKGLVKSRK